MKLLLLALLVLSTVDAPLNAQTNRSSKPASELTQLRQEFVKATNEYKASLARLMPFYEQDIARAEGRLELSRQLFTEGQVPRTQVEENERAVQIAKDKLSETKRRAENADKEIAAVLNDTAVDKEYQKAVQQRRKARKPRCSNWTLTAYQRTTANSVAFGYKIICQN